MSFAYGRLALATLSLLVLSLPALPCRAQTPDSPPTPVDSGDPAMKKVTLDLESTNLYTALKLLFGHINANYYLDPSLKNAEVSVHLHDVPFKTVLDTLVKSTGLPLTWKFEDNIYRIVPKEVETTARPEEGERVQPDRSEAAVPKVVVLSRDTFSFDGIAIAEALGGKNFSILPRLFDYPSYTGAFASGSSSGSNFGNGGLGNNGSNGSGGRSGSGGLGGGGFSSGGRGF